MVKSRFEAALVLQAHGDELKCKNRKLERHSRVQKQEKYFHGPGVQQKLNVQLELLADLQGLLQARASRS